MYITMIGREGCTRCEEMYPIIKKYCDKNNVTFYHKLQSDLTKKEISEIVSNKITLLPVFILEEEIGSKEYLDSNGILDRLSIGEK